MCVCVDTRPFEILYFSEVEVLDGEVDRDAEEQHPRLRSCCVLSGASGWCPYMYGACASFVRLHAHTLPQMLCLYGNQWPYPDLLLLCSPHFLIVDVDAVYAMCWMFSKDYVSTYFYIPQFGKSNQFWMYSEDSLTRHRGGS